MKSKKIIIAIIAVLVVLGGTFAGLWFFTGVFNFLKPANTVFSNQMEKALDLEGAKFSDYSKFLEEYKEISSKPYKSNLTMSANVNIPDLDSDVQKIINKSKITLETNADINNNKSQNKIGLYSDNSEVLTLDLVQNENVIGIGCKDLHDKYLTVSSEDLIKYLKENSSSLDLDLDSDELETMLNSLTSSNLDPYKLMYISEEDLKHFDDTYRNCLTTLISKDCYSTEKKVEVEVDGKDVSTTAYYLTLTGKDAYEFVSKLSDLVKDDSVLTKIITEKANLILEASSQEKISESDVKKFISTFIDQMMDGLDDIKDKDTSALQIAVYSKDSTPVRLDISSLKDVKKSDKKQTLFSIEYGKSKDIYTIYNNGTALAQIENEYSKNSKEEKQGTLTVKYSGLSIGTLKYELINKEDERKMAFELNISSSALSLSSLSSKDITASMEFNAKGNPKKEAVKVDGNMSFNYGKYSADVKFDGSIEYGEASIPELTSSNSINVLKLSNTELKTELSTILEKASKILPNRLKLIGIDVKADDIYPQQKETTTDTVNVESNENDKNAQETDKAA